MGDYPGHPFRGNQHTRGKGSMSPLVSKVALGAAGAAVGVGIAAAVSPQSLTLIKEGGKAAYLTAKYSKAMVSNFGVREGLKGTTQTIRAFNATSKVPLGTALKASAKRAVDVQRLGAGAIAGGGTVLAANSLNNKKGK